MARIYSTSYFHYTKDLNSLMSILQGGFMGHYCREEFKYKKSLCNIYVPQVSFCDVPLSFMNSLTYGDYAIGMSSIWGNAMKLTPVCYFPKSCKNPLTRYISEQASLFVQGNIKQSPIIGYAKPKSKYTTKGHPADNYKERECRRVQVSEISTDPTLHHQSCANLHLLFVEQDITFIIVKNDYDRDVLLHSISTWSTVGGNTKINNPSLICSKIITKLDLKSNF